MGSSQGYGGIWADRGAKAEEWARAKTRGTMQFGQGVWNRMGKSGIGRLAQQGIGMDYGFYRAGKAMPQRGPGGKFIKGSSVQGFKFMGGAFEGVRGSGSFGAASAQIQKNLGAKSAARAAGSLGLKALPLVGNLAFMYMGYQEGGIGGAIDAGIESAKIAVAWEIGAAALGSAALPLAIGAAAVGGAAYGYYQFGEKAQKYGRKMRKLEMGGEVTDRFGTMSTLRQRSLSALNNTHVNGRMALGNEAAIMHTPMY